MFSEVHLERPGPTWRHPFVTFAIPLSPFVTLVTWAHLHFAPFVMSRRSPNPYCSHPDPGQSCNFDMQINAVICEAGLDLLYCIKNNLGWNGGSSRILEKEVWVRRPSTVTRRTRRVSLAEPPTGTWARVYATK